LGLGAAMKRAWQGCAARTRGQRPFSALPRITKFRFA
jgi:hypothetical protein